MPFINRIADFINETLKAGSLNKKPFQPATFFGIATALPRTKNAGKKNDLEILPAILEENGRATYITPDSKKAVTIYHKLITNSYATVRKSYGDGYDWESTSELLIVVISNSKLTGRASNVLEPVVLSGMPQRLTPALTAELKIGNCLITPVASNMDNIAVFRQEFPQSDYFLTPQQSMFTIRYRIKMTFSQNCFDACECDSPTKLQK